MVCNGVDLLRFSFKLDRLTTLRFDSGSGLFVFAWRNCQSNPSVLYTSMRTVSGDATRIFYHWLSNLSDFLHVFLVIFSVALIGVDRRGGFYSLLFPTTNGMIGICPCGGFRRCYYFLDLFRYFYPLKHLASLLVGLPFEVPPLLIGLLQPFIRNGV